jgi:metal-responsive CopG/Arc/MetJ family transcriptional regulator
MATKVLISFPDDFLAEVDAAAQEEHRTRSELLREAVRFYLRSRNSTAIPRDDRRVQDAIRIMDHLSKAHPGKGEDSAEAVRYWRDQRIGADAGE